MFFSILEFLDKFHIADRRTHLVPPAATMEASMKAPAAEA
jgi:hypothetical protein